MNDVNEQIGVAVVAELVGRISRALEMAARYGGTDGSHHKDWVIDQMVRALTGPEYEKFVADVCNGDDGPETYSWDTGIAP